MTLLAAIITATALSIVGRPFALYQCWYSWGRLNAVFGVLLYLAIGGVGGGFLGWLAAVLAKAAPTDRPLLNGFLFGVAGALAVRADFSQVKRPFKQAAPTATVEHAASLLGAGIHWTTGMLDARSAPVITRWVGSLGDRELNKVALYVSGLIKELDVPPATRNTLTKNLVTAMEQVRSLNEKDHDEGRVLVEQFCASFILSHHLPKGSLPPFTA